MANSPLSIKNFKRILLARRLEVKFYKECVVGNIDITYFKDVVDECESLKGVLFKNINRLEHTVSNNHIFPDLTNDCWRIFRSLNKEQLNIIEELLAE